MILISLTYAVVMILLGVALYGTSDPASFTALIPSFFGLIAAGLTGLAVIKPKQRMHLMHGCVLLALIALLGGFGMGASKLGEEGSGRKLIGMFGMGIFSAVYLGLAIRTFIEARKAKKAEAANAPAETEAPAS